MNYFNYKGALDINKARIEHGAHLTPPSTLKGTLTPSPSPL